MPKPYTAEWFADRQDGQWTKMHHAWALDEILHPTSVIDVGCATGNMLLWWARYLTDIRLIGIEKYAEEARASADLEIRNDIYQGDVTQPRWQEEWWDGSDLALCIEVAEHLMPGTEDILVEGLTELSTQVFFSAAQPGQKGDAHVNCRKQEFWVAKFKERGYTRDLDLIERWRQLIPKDKGKNPRRNAMFFRKTS